MPKHLHKMPSHGHGHGGHHDTRHNQTHSSHGSHGDHAAETTLHQRGMMRREPNAVDASTRTRGPNVDSEATRGSTAPTPGTLGPRNA